MRLVSFRKRLIGYEYGEEPVEATVEPESRNQNGWWVLGLFLVVIVMGKSFEELCRFHFRNCCFI